MAKKKDESLFDLALSLTKPAKKDNKKDEKEEKDDRKDRIFDLARDIAEGPMPDKRPLSPGILNIKSSKKQSPGGISVKPSPGESIKLLRLPSNLKKPGPGISVKEPTIPEMTTPLQDLASAAKPITDFLGQAGRAAQRTTGGQIRESLGGFLKLAGEKVARDKTGPSSLLGPIVSPQTASVISFFENKANRDLAKYNKDFKDRFSSFISSNLDKAGESLINQSAEFLKNRTDLAPPTDIKQFTSGGYKDPRWYAEVIGSGAPQLLTSLAAGAGGFAAGGPAGSFAAATAVNFPLESGSAFNEYTHDLRESGLSVDESEEKAVDNAIKYGAVSSALESLLGVKIFGSVGKVAAPAARGIIPSILRTVKSIGSNFSIEGGTEAAQELAQVAIGQSIKNDKSAWVNAITSIKDPETVSRMIESFFAGGFMGLLGVPVELVYNTVSSPSKEVAIKNFSNSIREETGLNRTDSRRLAGFIYDMPKFAQERLAYLKSPDEGRPGIEEPAPLPERDDVEPAEQTPLPAQPIEESDNIIAEDTTADTTTTIDQNNKEEAFTEDPAAYIERKESVSDDNVAIEEDFQRIDDQLPRGRSLTSLKLRQNPEKITLSEKSLLNDRVRNFARGVRVGRRDRTIELGEIKSDIAKYARESTRGLDIPASKLNPLIKQVADAKTRNDVVNAFERIDNIVTDRISKKLVSSIQNEIKTAQSKVVSSRLRGRFGAEIQSQLDRISMLIDGKTMSRDQAMADIDKIISEAKSEKRGLTAEEISEISILNTVDIKNQSPAELARTLESIQQLKSDGRLAISERVEARKRQNEAVINKAIESITKGKGLDQNLQGGREETTRFKRFKKALKQSGFRLFSISAGFRSLIESFDMGESSSPWQGTLQQYIGRLIDRSRDAKLEKTQELQTRMEDAVADITGFKAGSSNYVKWFNEYNNEKFEFFTPKDGDKAVKHTPAEASDIWRYSLNEDTRQIMIENGQFTESQLQEIENNLTKEHKEYTLWKIEQYRNPEFIDRLNSVYDDAFGTTFALEDNYVGPIYREGVDLRNEDSIFEAGTPNSPISSVFGKSTKARTGSKKPLKFYNNDMIFSKYMHEMEHAIAFSEVIKRARDIFSDARVRQAIKQEYGSNVNQIVNKFINDIADDGRRVTSEAINIIDDLDRKHARAVIPGKLLITAKQLVSTPVYLTDGRMNTSDFILGLIQLAREPIKAANIMRESPWIRNRIGSDYINDVQALNTDINQLVENPKVKIFENLANDLASGKISGISFMQDMLSNGLFKTFMDIMSLPVRIGDVGAIMIGGYPFYLTIKKQAIKDGMSERDAHKYALDEMTDKARRTQQDGSVEAKSAPQRMGSLARSMMRYLTSPQQYFTEEALATMYLVNGRGKKLDAVKTILFHQVMLPIIFAYVSELGDPEKKDIFRAMLIGPLNGVFLIGKIIGFAGDKFMGNPWEGKVTQFIPALQVVEDVLASLYLLSQAKEWDNKDAANFSKKLLSSISLGFGVPLKTGAQLAVGGLTHINSYNARFKKYVGSNKTYFGNYQERIDYISGEFERAKDEGDRNYTWIRLYDDGVLSQRSRYAFKMNNQVNDYEERTGNVVDTDIREIFNMPTSPKIDKINRIVNIVGSVENKDDRRKLLDDMYEIGVFTRIKLDAASPEAISARDEMKRYMESLSERGQNDYRNMLRAKGFLDENYQFRGIEGIVQDNEMYNDVISRLESSL